MQLDLKDLQDLKINNPELYLRWINLYTTEFELNTKNRICSFFANVMQETANLFYLEEIASGEAYEGNVKLGNIYKGDGVKFKGRGAGQTTGRKNYYKFGLFVKEYVGINIDFTANPDLLKQPQWYILSAFFFWKDNNLETYADAGQFQQLCGIWNRGNPNKLALGFDIRKQKYVQVSKWYDNILNDKK